MLYFKLFNQVIIIIKHAAKAAIQYTFPYSCASCSSEMMNSALFCTGCSQHVLSTGYMYIITNVIILHKNQIQNQTKNQIQRRPTTAFHINDHDPHHGNTISTQAWLPCNTDKIRTLSCLQYTDPTRNMVLKIKKHSIANIEMSLALALLYHISKLYRERIILIPVPSNFSFGNKREKVHLKRICHMVNKRSYSTKIEVHNILRLKPQISLRLKPQISLMLKPKTSTKHNTSFEDKFADKLLRLYTKSKIQYKPNDVIVMVDDVMTTGATLSACYWILKNQLSASVVYSFAFLTPATKQY